MVTAKAQVTLPLGEFQPKSTLVTAEHDLERARFPVIDYHNHLDALDPVDVLRVMDACGIERMVNITMKTGDEAIRMIHKWGSVDGGRFATIGWMDWSDVGADNFVALTLDRLERLVEHVIPLAQIAYLRGDSHELLTRARAIEAIAQERAERVLSQLREAVSEEMVLPVDMSKGVAGALLAHAGGLKKLAVQQAENADRIEKAYTARATKEGR